MSQLTPDETILGLLAAEARHGYQLRECFRDPTQLGEVWNLSTSQLYAVLKRLDTQGYISGCEVESADAPPRMEYVLTNAGITRLQTWLEEESPSPSIRRVRVEFLSRLYIARLLNISTAGIIKRQKDACRQQRTALLAQHGQMQPGIGLLTIELVVAQLDAIIQWIDRCELIPRGFDEEDMP